jgi:V/A-type H+-transporting ATPase subunit F
MNSTQPLVVEIPDRHHTQRTPDSITRYIREAIGVKV